tara:strand:+ start:1137 stop:2342 length:1206 start_codon:yes stop_codon:yes gene_type:complete
MRNLFKITCLVLITLNSLNAQRKEVYLKSFDVNKQTIATINLQNISVSIEESFDDRIYFDYSIEFTDYSKKEIDDLLKKIEVDASLLNNYLTLRASSESKMTVSSFELKSSDRNGIGVVYEDSGLKNKKTNINKENVIKRKSKESVILEINKNEVKNIENILSSFRQFEASGKQKEINVNDVKYKRSHFIVKIPSYVKLIVLGDNSNIELNPIFENVLEVTIENSSFRANELLNPKNKIKIEKGNFMVKKINGGDYILNSISNGLIGSISESKITSEFSKIEIGEIGKNNSITDFNGKLWFYDFSTEFKNFSLKSEYSKVHLFYPTTDFGLRIMANNAVNVTIFSKNGNSTGGESRVDSPYVLMDRKAKRIGDFSGDMNLEMDNGFTFLYEENFESNKEND